MVIENHCPVAHTCGGCFYTRESYEEQLRLKLERLRDYDQLPEPTKIHRSPSPLGQRSRALLRLRLDEQAVGFFSRGERNLVSISRCPTLSQPINDFLRFLKAEIPRWPVCSERYRLSVQQVFDQRILLDLTPGQRHSPNMELVVQSLKKAPGIILDQGVYKIDHQDGADFYITPGMFHQSHLVLNQILRNRVKHHLTDSGGILDLFCGNGNLSEIPRSKGRLVEGWDFETLKAPHQKGDANKAPLQGFASIIVDPPRSGLANPERFLNCDASRLIYVSCNLETLNRDLSTLLGRWQMDAFETFDMFPFTEHLEALVVLKRASAHK